ncbi:MAG TPA: AraC family transcriptional regulator [Acidobacteriaceae bacterium]|nr:AraC family transcriptional regulator [Acidobacteriaceae bacterium]
MTHFLYTPPGPLSRVVQCFWYWEGAPTGHTKERLMPTGEASVIFNLRDEPIRIYNWRNLNQYETYGTAVLAGARSEPFAIDTQQQERVFGIQFQPGGSFPFFHVPSSEVVNLDVPLECVWRTAADTMRTRLLEAGSVPAMLAVAEEELLRQLVRPLELHPAVAFAAQRFTANPHRTTVACVLDSIGLSHRRFSQLFQEQTGLAPKVFCRVRRFQRVLSSLNKMRRFEWAQIALDCGYYDQAHFIHDFQSFSGFTPTSYAEGVFARPEENRHMNHVPL